MPRVIGVGGARRGQRRGHRRHAGRRRHDEVAVAVAIDELPRRPLEQIVACRAAGEPQAAKFLEVGELREIDVGVVRIEALRGPNGRTERLDRIGEARGASVELRAGVPYLKRRRRPAQRAEQRGKPVIVDARDAAEERAVQIVAALVEMKRAGVVGIPGDAPRLVCEENLAHPREVDARLHLIGLLRPAPQVDVAGGDR